MKYLKHIMQSKATIIDFVDDDKVKVVLLDKRKGLNKEFIVDIDNLFNKKPLNKKQVQVDERMKFEDNYMYDSKLPLKKDFKNWTEEDWLNYGEKTERKK